MTIQFIAALICFGLVVGFTARLWLTALQQIEFRRIANFYRVGFLVMATCLAILIWAQAFFSIEPEIGYALFQGFSASTVVLVLFGWGRLTALGLKFDATHQKMID